MEVTYDPAKDKRNIAKHGLSLALAAELDWDAAVVREDEREDYGEHRYRAFVPFGGQLYTAVVVWRKGSMRAISLRQANAKEKKKYEEEIR